MTTAGQLIDRAYQGMLAGVVEKRNKLAEVISTTTDDTVVLSWDTAGFRDGVVFEIGSELFYISSANTATKTMTVERGFLGTTKATHTLGDLVTLNPKFPRHTMLEELNADMDDLSSGGFGVYAVKTLDVAYTGGLRQVDVVGASNVINLLEAFYRYSTSDFIPINTVEIVTDLPVADFPSTFGLRVHSAFNTGTIRVSYSTEFVHATAESSDLQTLCLLPASCEDIIKMGIQIRMMAGREIKRNFTEAQPDTRRAEEVTPGSVRASTASLERGRNNRIRAEANRLSRRYPTTIR